MDGRAAETKPKKTVIIAGERCKVRKSNARACRAGPLRQNRLLRLPDF
jgi:hypothetical protein